MAAVTNWLHTFGSTSIYRSSSVPSPSLPSTVPRSLLALAAASGASTATSNDVELGEPLNKSDSSFWTVRLVGLRAAPLEPTWGLALVRHDVLDAPGAHSSFPVGQSWRPGGGGWSLPRRGHGFAGWWHRQLQRRERAEQLCGERCAEPRVGGHGPGVGEGVAAARAVPAAAPTAPAPGARRQRR